MSSEIEYRAYVVGLDGHFLWSNEFLAPDDEAACEHAQQYVDAHDDVEVWSGGRFVASLKSTRPPL
jgi:hypothetical protein